MKLPIPSQVFDQIVAVLAKTRSGKSSVLRLMVEDLLDHKRPVCIVDPKGDWWGLKLSADGKKAGYPVVIFGGEHADVPINEHAGAGVAELVATGNRPCIVDLKGWMPGARARFWVDFASTLFKMNRGQRWLVCDEFHNFAPKARALDPNDAKALHWSNRIASEGLGLGIHLLFASQRPQKVHNDVLTSAETLIAMRVLHPSDRAAISDWIKGCGDPRLGTDVMNSLADLERGEGWVWSPEIRFGPKRIKFPKYETYDSFKAPEPGDDKRLTGWASVDLDEVKTRLAAIVAEAEANDPEKLKARIRQLEAEKSKIKPVTAVAADAKAVEKARADGDAAGYARGKIEGYRDAVNGIGPELIAQISTVIDIGSKMTALRAAVQKWMDSVPKSKPVPVVQRSERAAHNGRDAGSNPAGHTIAYAEGDLPEGERKILTAIAQSGGSLKRFEISQLAGYKRSSLNTYISRLLTKGFVEKSGEDISATPSGLAALGGYDRLPTGDALLQHWLGKLPDGERKILSVVARVYPSPMPRDSISEMTDYRRSSTNTYISRLVARKLITAEREGVTASPMLFDNP